MDDKELGTERIAEALREHTGGLADAVTEPAPDAQVPTCPEWTVRDLVGHVGQAHRWVTEMVRAGSAESATPSTAATPDSPGEWPGWLRGGADALVRAVEVDPHRTVAHPAMGTRPAVMWLRRMLHDTAVHHADAAITAGVPYAVAPDIAADGLDEWLGLVAEPLSLTYKPELAELRGNGETLALRPSEPSLTGWVITRGADGIGWERASRDGDLTVAGPVRDLMLVFARRLAPDDADVKVTGDRPLLDHWLARTVF